MLVFFAINFTQAKLHITVRAKGIRVEHLTGDFQLVAIGTINVQQFCFEGHRWIVHITAWLFGLIRDPDIQTVFDFNSRFVVSHNWRLILNRRFNETRWGFQRVWNQKRIPANWTLAHLPDIRFVT